MNDTYAFLDLLGLDDAADERAIRRAYAKKLKQVDQALDPAGFQALREAYEEALDWAAWQAQEGQEAQRSSDHAAIPVEQALAASLADKTSESGEAEEARLAAAVWERFQAGAERLAQGQRLGDPDAWHALLLERLADDELVHIGARTQFEQCIVRMLGSGWRPGHEALFPAAVAAFDWARDRRRLALFDDYGSVVNAAIDERALFDSQALAVRSVQDRVAMLLRRKEQPDRREIIQSMGDLRTMQEFFPALLIVITDPDNVAQWEAAIAEHETEPPRVSGGLEKAARGLVTIAMVAVALKSVHFLHEQQAARAAAEPGQQHSRADDRKARRNPPTEEQLAVHLAPFNYVSPPGAKPGYYKLKYDVVLDAEGKVVATKKLLGNPLPGFEAAAEASLRAAKPFPPSTGRLFTISLMIHVNPERAAPARPPMTRSA